MRDSQSLIEPEILQHMIYDKPGYDLNIKVQKFNAEGKEHDLCYIN